LAKKVEEGVSILVERRIFSQSIQQPLKREKGRKREGRGPAWIN